jgi:RNA polymerase sigma factor (sigma-70 family)
MYGGGIPAALRHLRTLAAVATAAAHSDGELLGRFAETHDEAAFTALMERHGPMVLRVCRRILGHAQDAEDACQATFLVLVRKAASVRKRGSAASWLYGTAARTARKLQASRARRERGCGGAEDAMPDTARDDPSWREVRAMLDEELLRLPEKYRAPLVLCYLEGLTRDEAARRLGLSPNRLRGLLDYGRGLLRGRLSRRGVGLPAVLLAGLVVREAPAAVPALLVVSTVKAAALTAAGRALPAGLVPARVVALTQGMVRTMLTAKLQVTSAVLLLAGFALGASAVLPSVPAADPGANPGVRGTFRPDWLDDPLYRASEALVGWWPADGHAFDLAGPNHGNRAGSVAFANGCCGEGFSFPDGNGSVMVGRSPALVNTFTLVAWVSPAATREAPHPVPQYAGITGQRYAIFPTHGGEAGKEAGCGISVGTNGIGLFEHTHDNCPCVLAHDAEMKGWTHVAVVYVQGQPTLYVNGETVKKGARSPWAVFPGTYFGDPNIGYGPYQGLLDEPMLFDRGLSADEIKAVVRASRLDKPAGKGGPALSDAEFSELWSYLSGAQAPRSLFAIHHLAASGDETVRRLRPLVAPPPVSDKPSVEELVLLLDDDEYSTRERATRSLIEKGAGVVSTLRGRLQGRLAPEARARIERVLEHFNDPRPTAERLRALRAVTVLGRIATPSSRALLAELADGPEAMPATIAARAALAQSGASERKSDR